jgi:ABC-type molybdenum transport system ATPase subunit/photorepair protein PhrA
VPPHGFVGRSRELLALERLLERERYAVVLGEGGEGKTTLASELARWLVATRRFARAAFVSLEHALDVRSVIFALGEQLVAGYVSEASKDPEKALPLIERALRERPTVVVLDNMETVLPPPEREPDSSRKSSPRPLLFQRRGGVPPPFPEAEAPARNLPPPFEKGAEYRVGKV